MKLSNGCIEGMPRHEDRGRKPVRQREAGAQRQDAVRRTQPLFAPAHKCEPQVMTPIVRVDRYRFPRRRDRLARISTAMKHKGQRAPRLARPGIEPAPLTRVMHRLPQGRRITHGIGPRRFEGKYAGIGHSDMRRGVVGRRAERRIEGLASAAHGFPVERLERGASFHERAVWREQCVEVGV